MAAKKTAAKAKRGGVKAKKGGAKSKAKKPRTRSAVLQAHLDTFSKPPRETFLAGKNFELAEEHEIPATAWEALLKDIAETGNITDSCKRCGIKRVTVYKRAARNQEFKDAMEEAHGIGLRALEDHAVRRATQGVAKDIYFQGDVVGQQIEYSDQLLMFLLQGRDPRYKRKQEITGADGGALSLLMKLDDRELDAEIARRQRELDEATNAQS